MLDLLELRNTAAAMGDWNLVREIEESLRRRGISPGPIDTAAPQPSEKAVPQRRRRTP